MMGYGLNIGFDFVSQQKKTIKKIGFGKKERTKEMKGARLNSVLDLQGINEYC